MCTLLYSVVNLCVNSLFIGNLTFGKYDVAVL